MFRAAHAALAALLALSACQGPTSPQPAPRPGIARAAVPREPQPSVEVDFARPRATRSMSGFLHGISGAAPQQALVSPLRPAYWRIGTFDSTNAAAGTNGIYPRLRDSTRASIQVVLSDLWGYPNYWTKRWPYEAGPSGVRWAEWEAFVARIAHESRGRDVTWDVWNEPDIAAFWPQSDSAQRLFHETYRRAYRVLRDSLPGAVIGGPSYSQYSPGRIAAFADYCSDATHPCEANFLSWHELDWDIPGIASRLRNARATFVDAPRYASLRLRELHVNETVSEQNRNFPGAAVNTLYYLEQGGADRAARTCWQESDGRMGCENNSIDGLLTSDLRPRATWWAYKAYADGVDARVASTASDARIVALGSARVAGTADAAQALLGFSSPDRLPASASVAVRLANLTALPFVSGRNSVRVQVWRIPNSLEAALPRMELVSDRRATISGGGVSLTVNAEMNHAYVVMVLKN
jgi:hypothetical protein